MTKTIILIAIAGGLWANALAPLVTARTAYAQDTVALDMRTIVMQLELIHHDIENIAAGICTNSKLCGH
jgi:hypothetical protein